MDGRSDQSGYFYNHGSYDQMVAGIRPGDSYGTAQWKLQSHYSAGGRDATGASLYATAPASFGAYPRYAGGGGGGGAHSGGGGGGAAFTVPPAVRAFVRLVFAGVSLAVVGSFLATALVAPGLNATDGVKTLPETPFFSTATVAPRLPGYAALDALPTRSLGVAAALAMKLRWDDPRALAVGAAALHRMERPDTWVANVGQYGRRFGGGVDDYALMTMARRFVDQETRLGSVDAAMDQGLLDVSRKTLSYRPGLAMARWNEALRAHPDDPRLRALVDQYRSVFGFELVRMRVRDWLRPLLPPGSLPD